MATIRHLHSNEMAQAIRLADSIFRNQDQISMSDAYPSVFSSGLGQSYGVFEGNDLVSFMGLVPATVLVGEARLNIYSIGAVCTHPDARGRGYGSRLMSTVIAHANKAGASLILISGNRSLYTRLACFPFGSMKRYTLDEENTSSIRLRAEESGLRVREWRSTDVFHLNKLTRTRKTYYEQSLTDLASLIHSESYGSNQKLQYKVLIAEREGEVTAFTVIAMSGDRSSARTPFAVEWAGDAMATAAILAHAIQAYRLERLQAQINWHQIELHEIFDSIPNEQDQNSGLIHLVNVDHLCAQLEPYLHTRGGTGMELAKQLEQLGEEERIKLLFNPITAHNSVSSILPLPFPYTVGLNYV